MYRVILMLGLPALVVLATLPVDPLGAADEVEFTEEYLSDRQNIETGRDLFQQQCSRCHGRGAYPGKAPRLKPAKMPPDEIYLKVTYGFGRMPPWEDVFSDEERKAITAYMKSDIFSN